MVNAIDTLVDLFTKSNRNTIIDYRLIQDYIGFDIRDGHRHIMRSVKRQLERNGIYVSPIRGTGYYIN